MVQVSTQAAQEALRWYLDNGVDDVLGAAPVGRVLEVSTPVVKPFQASKTPQNRVVDSESSDRVSPSHPSNLPTHQHANTPVGTGEAKARAVELAKDINTLEDLREAIAGFDGLAIKKTATNMVFSDGHAGANVMLIGEAPGADEDRQGKPFVGVSGQLLDRILACIDLDRAAEAPEKAVYISNILNWRPPGNRTPSPAEIDVSLPFIEKHIMLAKPDILIFCGGVSAKALLGSGDSVSKLRKTWHAYKPQTAALGYQAEPIPALVTYHPAYLLRTPAQKRAVWQDMLMLQERICNS